MAKSVSEYYDLLIAEKEQSMPSLTGLTTPGSIPESSQNLLNDLTTTSRVGRWRLMVWLMAFALYIHETILESLASESEVGIAAWYQKIALEFELGIPLVLVNYRPQYENPNPANRIVKLAAIVEPNNTSGLVIKVAKIQNNLPIPLTPQEKTAFIYYMRRRRIAGTKIIIVSKEGDTLKLAFKIYYDPLIIESTGALTGSPGVFPVENAIRSYLNNLPFDGTLHLDLLTDAVQRVQGVKHVILLSAHTKKDGQTTYQDIMLMDGQKYNPEAGYFKLSDATNETLPALLQYIPN